MFTLISSKTLTACFEKLRHFHTNVKPNISAMPSTIYCYHCRAQHSRDDMRLIVTKTGKRWRCAQSIEAAKVDREAREAFGRRISAINKAKAQTKLTMRSKPERSIMSN